MFSNVSLNVWPCTIFIYSDSSSGWGVQMSCETSSQNKFYSKPGHGIVKGNLQDVLTNKEVYNWSLMLHNVPQKEEGTFSWEIKEEDREERRIIPYLLENAPED